MKKLISILLIISTISSFTMSIGCLAQADNLLNDHKQDLLLQNDLESVCGFTCKTKNYAGTVWKTIKGIPDTIKLTVATVGTATAAFVKLYKIYKSTILKLNAEKMKLLEENNALRNIKDEKGKPFNENNELRAENNNLSDQNKKFSGIFKGLCSRLEKLDTNFSNFFTNTTQHIDALEIRIKPLSEKISFFKAQKTQKEKETKKLLSKKDEEIQIQQQELQVKHDEEMKKLQAELENAQRLQAELEKKIEAQKPQAELNQAEREKYEEKIQKLQKEIENKNACIEDHIKKYKLLQQSYDQRIKDIQGNILNDSQNENLQQLEEKEKIHKEEIKKIKKQHENQIQENEVKIESLQNQLQKSKERITELQNQLQENENIPEVKTTKTKKKCKKTNKAAFDEEAPELVEETSDLDEEAPVVEKKRKRKMKRKMKKETKSDEDD